MMTTRHPIPDAALDDRLGFLGMTGSGKTYGAGTVVERVLARRGRAIIPDPLGVWWGLRLLADGKTPSPFEIVIFGGPHADLPLTPHAGALIGETVATMRESAIIDLSQFETAASERRFMLAFLEALYRKTTGEPVHLIFDEADLWAPERIVEKEGEATRLHGMMQSVVRRGRIKGLTSWLISQRPAVLSKSVLSQVDGLVAFRLTASQDRKALGLWIEGQADREAGKAILGRLPEKRQGEAVVWLPQRGILADVSFPPKETYDSSRAPKRGEKRRAVELRPVDLGALKEKLATVEAEVKANDPKALKAKVAELTRELQRAQQNIPKNIPAPDPDAEQRAYEQGYLAGMKRGWQEGHESAWLVIKNTAIEYMERRYEIAPEMGPNWPPKMPRPSVGRRPTAGNGGGPNAKRLPHHRQSHNETKWVESGDGSVTRPQQKILDAIAWMGSLGTDQVPREIVAFLAGASPNSSGYANNLGTLRTAGLIDYPTGGFIALTASGRPLATPPEDAPTHEAIMAKIGEKLPRPQMRILEEASRTYPEAVDRDDLAARVEASATSSGYANNLGRLRTLGLITYPSSGKVRADDRLFP
jgi:hypothetical protein